MRRLGQRPGRPRRSSRWSACSPQQPGRPPRPPTCCRRWPARPPAVVAMVRLIRGCQRRSACRAPPGQPGSGGAKPRGGRSCRPAAPRSPVPRPLDTGRPSRCGARAATGSVRAAAGRGSSWWSARRAAGTAAVGRAGRPAAERAGQRRPRPSGRCVCPAPAVPRPGAAGRSRPAHPGTELVHHAQRDLLPGRHRDRAAADPAVELAAAHPRHGQPRDDAQLRRPDPAGR